MEWSSAPCVDFTRFSPTVGSFERGLVGNYDEDDFEGYYELQERSVWVVGTHLQRDHWSVNGETIREKQAASIAAWIDKGVKSGKFDMTKEDPVIIAGDLNTKFRKTPGELLGFFINYMTKHCGGLNR